MLRPTAYISNEKWPDFRVICNKSSRNGHISGFPQYAPWGGGQDGHPGSNERPQHIDESARGTEHLPPGPRQPVLAQTLRYVRDPFTFLERCQERYAVDGAATINILGSAGPSGSPTRS